MAHLSSHGIPCPKPIANLQNELLGELNGKPATIVTSSRASRCSIPALEHCARVGEVLAEMHLAGQTYRGQLDNLRGPSWWSDCCSGDLSVPERDRRRAAQVRDPLSGRATATTSCRAG